MVRTGRSVLAPAVAASIAVGGGALAAGLALPSVILMMMFGQTRIFFVMSRDGLLPQAFSKIHPKFNTPHVITIITGIAVALFALGELLLPTSGLDGFLLRGASGIGLALSLRRSQ